VGYIGEDETLEEIRLIPEEELGEGTPQEIPQEQPVPQEVPA
jgi:hypothetical protein